MAAVPNHEWLKPFEMTALEEYFMAVFWQLNRDREADLSGMPRSIKLQTLVYYQELFNDKLSETELEVLQNIDSAYLTAIAEIRKDNNG